MVKFGERYPDLQQRDWRAQYLDYIALRSMIEAGNLDDKASAEFLDFITREMAKVDAFVEMKLESIEAQYRSAPASERAAARDKIHQELSMLRHFVGTNIIAATKIVKKHDKNVSPHLHKRERVAEIIRLSRGMNRLPTFQREVDGKPKGSLSPKSVAVDISETATGGAEDDDDESEAKLRSLPNWLLAGAATKELHTEFYDAYLRGWGLQDSDDEGAPMCVHHTLITHITHTDTEY